MGFVYRLFNLRRRDRRILGTIGPIFALVTGANVVTNSFARALYIAYNPPESLPWMFICASLFTVGAALAYVNLIGRWQLKKRFRGLVAFTLVSFCILGVLVDLDASGLSLFVYTWSTGLGQLIMIQAWSYSSTVLPTRQARRLFPVFAAFATVGAVVGGLATSAIMQVLAPVGEGTPVGGLGILVYTAVLLLAGALYYIHRTVDQPQAPAPAPAPAPDDAAPAPSTLRPGFLAAFDSIRRIPLLGGIALLAFLLQLSSVVMDFQFSAALKWQYADGETEMATFFGLYYAGSNALTLVLALTAGSRLTRLLGIGVAASSPALVLALGALVSLPLFYLGSPLLVFAVFGTSFIERVFGFGVGKHALHVAITPVEADVAERAKFVIDGVIYRLAYALPSVFFLFFGELLVDFGTLSPAVLVTALLAVLVGHRLGRHYRQALFEGLKTRRLDAAVAESSTWAEGDFRRLVDSLVESDQRSDVLGGLAIAEEFRLTLPDATVERVLRRDDPELAAATLRLLATLGTTVSERRLAPFLQPDAAPELLREVLRLLPRRSRRLAPQIQQLVRHADPTVVSLAFMWLRSMDEPTGKFEAVSDDFESRLVDDLTHHTARVRDAALEQMGELALPEHVAPLLDALASPLLRTGAIAALLRMGTERVLPVVAHSLWSDGADVVGNVWVVRLVEQLGGNEGLEILGAQLDAPNLAVRNQTIQSVWRLARNGDLQLPQPAELKRCVLGELDLLSRYACFDATLLVARGQANRIQFMRREIAIRRALGETRAFRLLGMIYQRAAVERAYLHYRDPDARTRSNAIELLDQLIDDGELKKLIAYIEATEQRDGRSISMTGGAASVLAPFRLSLGERTQPEAILGEDEVWLQRVYDWALPETDAFKGDLTVRDQALDRVLLLRGISLFESIPGDQLLPLAEIAKPARYSAGEVVFREGAMAHHLYLVTSGSVEVLKKGSRVAVLGERECFGEMAILDESTRSATVTALEPVECLRLEGSDFENLLELHPSLAKAIIRVLTRRLRNKLEADAVKL